MNLKNTKRALLGALVVIILLAVILYRRQGAPFGEQDYLIVGAAVVLVLMNVIGSYYFDRKAHREDSSRK